MKHWYANLGSALQAFGLALGGVSTDYLKLGLLIAAIGKFLSAILDPATPPLPK